jgi:hypothetical protein
MSPPCGIDDGVTTAANGSSYKSASCNGGGDLSPFYDALIGSLNDVGSTGVHQTHVHPQHSHQLQQQQHQLSHQQPHHGHMHQQQQQAVADGMSSSSTFGFTQEQVACVCEVGPSTPI